MSSILVVAGPELGRLPHTSLLTGIPEFSAGKTAGEGEGEPSPTVQAISHLKSQPDGQKASTAMVPTGDGLPALSKKCIEKILVGDFVDLADLPPARGKVKAIPSASEGQIVMVQAADLMEHRKLIPDLATCMGAVRQHIRCRDNFKGARAGEEPLGIHVPNC